MLLHYGSRKKSFTLVELIISMVLVGIVSIVSLEFCAQYLKMAFNVSSKTMAVNYAQAGMETLYMNGSWINGNDTPYAGMSRTWNTTNGTNNPSTNTMDYTVVTVNVRS